MNHFKLKVKELESVKRELRMAKTQLIEEQKSKTRQSQFYKDALESAQQELDIREKSILTIKEENKRFQHLIHYLKHHIKSLNSVVIEQKLQLSHALKNANIAITEYQDTEEYTEIAHQLMIKGRKIYNQKIKESRIRELELTKYNTSLKENLNKYENQEKQRCTKCIDLEQNLWSKRNTQKVSQSDPTKHHQIEQDSTIFEANGVDKKHEDEIMELKAKFLRHKEILKFNCDEAESEVIRLDEIYHDTVDMVLKAFNSIPEIVESNAELLKIKTSLESSLLEAQQESASVKQTVDGPIK